MADLASDMADLASGMPDAASDMADLASGMAGLASGMAGLASGSRAADDGNAALELLILAPVILALIGLVIAAGRTSVAQESVDAAARDAARQASISLTPDAARQAAAASAYAALRADGLHCRPVVSLDLAPGFGSPPGQPAQVSALVSCTVRLSDLLVPGVPGTRTLTARFTSPLDPYRSRTLGFSSSEGSSGVNPNSWGA